jgi:hypothetical protein
MHCARAISGYLEVASSGTLRIICYPQLHSSRWMSRRSCRSPRVEVSIGLPPTDNNSGGRGEQAGQVNLRYGTEPGVLFYTHVSDQYAPFHTKVINATVRDATHVLDGLLYHESDLKIEEHYTDTAGFTDHPL